MNASLSLVAELPKRLTGREECTLLLRALVQRETPAIRLKLAQLYNAFDDAIALLDRAGAPTDCPSSEHLAQIAV